jgi:hypothetical protein
MHISRLCAKISLQARKKVTLGDLLNVRTKLVLLLNTQLIHQRHCSLMQLVDVLPCLAIHQYCPAHKDLRLLRTRRNPSSFASATSFTSLLARLQFPVSDLVIH